MLLCFAEQLKEVIEFLLKKEGGDTIICIYAVIAIGYLNTGSVPLHFLLYKCI